jgi:hypothetical protein
LAIGRAYYLGIGLEQDHQKSKYWFSRAADGDIDTSLAPDFEGKPGSNAVVMKAIGLTVKLTGRRLHKTPFC